MSAEVYTSAEILKDSDASQLIISWHDHFYPHDPMEYVDGGMHVLTFDAFDDEVEMMDRAVPHTRHEAAAAGLETGGGDTFRMARAFLSTAAENEQHIFGARAAL